MTPSSSPARRVSSGETLAAFGIRSTDARLAPDIIRQRLLVEASFDRSLVEQDIADYLNGVASALDLRTYGQPIIHAPGGDGKDANQGYDAFVPLIDSGIVLYVWTNAKFLSVVFYTCKAFSVEDAVEYTTDFFNVVEIEHKAF